LETTAFAEPPQHISSLVNALTLTKGTRKTINIATEPKLPAEQVQELKQQVEQFLARKVATYEQAKWKGKSPERITIDSTTANASDEDSNNHQYYTPEPENEQQYPTLAEVTGAKYYQQIEEITRTVSNFAREYQNPFNHEVPPVDLTEVFRNLKFPKVQNPERNEQLTLATEQEEENNQDRNPEPDQENNQPKDNENQDQSDEDEALPNIVPQNNPPVVADNLPPPSPASSNNGSQPATRPNSPPHSPHLHPAQLDDDEEEMASVPYPVFDGTNPKAWLAQMDRALKANGVRDDNDDKRLGIAACHMGPYQEWIGLSNPPITRWTHAGNPQGFVQRFMTEFFTIDTKSEAMEIASRRSQKPGESIDVYRAALEKIWQECDQAELTDNRKLRMFLNGLTPAIRMSVKQTQPANLAAALTTAKAHYRAVKEEMQPQSSSSAEVNEVLAGEIKELKEELARLKVNPQRQQYQLQQRQYAPQQRYVPQQRQRQQIVNIKCFYCGKPGHRQFDCRLKDLHMREGRRLEWRGRPQNRPDEPRQGKGQPRQ